MKGKERSIGDSLSCRGWCTPCHASGGIRESPIEEMCKQYRSEARRNSQDFQQGFHCETCSGRQQCRVALFLVNIWQFVVRSWKWTVSVRLSMMAGGEEREGARKRFSKHVWPTSIEWKVVSLQVRWIPSILAVPHHRIREEEPRSDWATLRTPSSGAKWAVFPK